MGVLFSESDWDSFSESSEDQEELDFIYGNQAHYLLSNLEETIGKIDDFLSFERGFLRGDIVCSAANPSGQTGKVVAVDMSVDLESTNGKVIRDINSRKISKIRSICAGDYVVHGHWVGRVDRVIDSVSIVFNDGMRCDVIAVDQERIVPISPNPVDDPLCPYFPGQRVQVKLPVVSRQARWLCGSWKASHEEGTVCAVKAGLVQVEWLGSALSQSGLNVPPPQNLQNAKNVTVLSCFSHSNWQLGDWCSVPIGKTVFAHQRTGNGFQRKDSNPNNEGIFVVSRTRTRVDVLWQDGTRSLGEDSQSLLPVNIVDVHEFWPDQFVLMKSSSEDPQAPMTQKWGVVRSMDSKEKTVKVAWKNLSLEESNGVGEEMVSAYELIDHPDYSFCLGDIVFRSELDSGGEANKGNSENSYLSSIGNVVGFKDGTVEVQWATGFTNKVDPCEIFRCDKLEVPTASSVAFDDNIVDQISQQAVDYDMHSSDLKGKDLLSCGTFNDEERRKYPWEGIPLPLPRSAIGFLRGFAASVFGSAGSTSELDSSLSGPVHEDRNPRDDYLDKEIVGTLDSGMQLKTVVSEVAGSEMEVLPEFENKDIFLIEENGDERFKRFDMVGDCSDHFFLDQAGKELGSSQVKRAWFKKVRHEWSILEKNLPETIYVRSYEERMDLLRAAIVGAPGTPYHKGLFFFDIFLPPEFPNVPPMVHYHSGGLRLNPNLYESGKVCLSLLNTWTGTGSEVWDPQNSTVLQVLVSLQALVLNDRPYFNEAGYDKQVGKAEGEKNSVSYNENAFLLNCKSMIYLLRKPPKHFEALVLEHFGNCCLNILSACKEYMDGAPVGFPSGHGIEREQENHKGSSTGFKIMLTKLCPKLIEAFEEKGFDCSQFMCP
ncbi:probable ubiquitin-conjugating enzyme E2 24 [Punica granatum]|uniref:E2 ubiquitin-conjugating enzyme n=2 Tax=Punica granatum TaxID=22663 RepID=A0A218WZ04_PUNGR|nr:probable ubiquitin-conjugating enzyme E2 24 [Punica granatum]OWM77461.1 hypothetical protein CDL15_Pgr016858 [Punica granatum]PKI69448.1 hypothetical protein CRG98_010151 [Punica granatum]